METLLSFIYNRASWVAARLDRILMRIDAVVHVSMASVLSGIEKERDYGWNAVFVPEDGRKCSFQEIHVF